MRRRLGAALVLVLVALGAVNYLRPIPSVSAAALLPATDLVPGTAPALPWPARGSAAVGVSGLGFIASSGNEQTIPAASVTKVMTALIVLEDHKLKKGESGPSITITDTDVQSYQSDLQQGQSVAKVAVGETLTELQLLQGMLIPSANNFAETLARWDVSSPTSIDPFVAKMNARAAALHLTHTKFADVAGASANSVSTATDLLTLGMLAMQDEVFADTVARAQVDLPVAGTVINVNGALGHNGIIGIKTGSGLNTGANYLFAAHATVDSHVITIFGCLMGLPTLLISFDSAQALITAMTAVLHVRRVISRNQSIATYTAPWGDQTDLIATYDLDLAEWPGMVVRQRLEANPLVLDKPLPPSTQEGTEHVVLGDYVEDVPLVTADPMYPPGRLWRLTRLSF
jgi:serine-type D-Ala-D-Ala carboxypeptidase (penicillin-binding protein 5/6)